MFKHLLLALGLAGTPTLALTQEQIDVDVNWDDAARQWTVVRPVGLSAKAETFSLLISKLQAALPAYLEETDQWPDGAGEVSFVVDNRARITLSRQLHADSCPIASCVRWLPHR